MAEGYFSEELRKYINVGWHWGWLLAESISVIVSGALTANGGGGGGHNPAVDGTDALRTGQPAVGGGTVQNSPYRGGDGGAGATAATVAPGPHGGAGGGGVGRIRVLGTMRDLANGVISPAPSEGTPAP